MGKKVTSNQWLNILVYGVLPLVTILGLYSTVMQIIHFRFELRYIISFIVQLALVAFYGITFYHSYNKNKVAYPLLQIMLWVSTLEASISYAYSEHYNSGKSFILMFLLYLGICSIAWVYTNLTYLRRRKHLFKNEFVFEETVLGEFIKDKRKEKEVPKKEETPKKKKDDEEEE